MNRAAFHEAGHIITLLALGGTCQDSIIRPDGSGLTRYFGLGDEEAAIVAAAGSAGEFMLEMWWLQSSPKAIDFSSPYRYTAGQDFKMFKELETTKSWYQAFDQAGRILKLNKQQLADIAAHLGKHKKVTGAELALVKPILPTTI